MLVLVTKKLKEQCCQVKKKKKKRKKGKFQVFKEEQYPWTLKILIDWSWLLWKIQTKNYWCEVELCQCGVMEQMLKEVIMNLMVLFQSFWEEEKEEKEGEIKELWQGNNCLKFMQLMLMFQDLDD